jgi:hypothetical protein
MWRFSPFPTEEEKAKTVFYGELSASLSFYGLLIARHTWKKVTFSKGKP